MQSWEDLEDKERRATFEEIGTVFGLAMDQSTGDLYAGAYQKRFAGLKREPGTIFKITPQPNRQVSVFRTTGSGSRPPPDERQHR